MFCKSKQSESHPTRYMMISIDDDYDEPTIRYIQYETDLDIDMDVGFRYLGLYIPSEESTYPDAVFITGQRKEYINDDYETVEEIEFFATSFNL